MRDNVDTIVSLTRFKGNLCLTAEPELRKAFKDGQFPSLKKRAYRSKVYGKAPATSCDVMVQ
jgi:hypothetical protein